MELALGLGLGLAIGVALGALGGGGSVLAIPALVYVLGQSPHQATSMSLIIVGVGALGGLVGHWRAGTIRMAAGLGFGAVGVVGSLVGTRLNQLVDGNLLLAMFAALMVIVAALMWKRAPRTGDRNNGGRDIQTDEAPTSSGNKPHSGNDVTKNLARITAWGSLVGLLTGFFGVGGGFVIVPALTLALGYSMPVAVATSLVVIVVNVGTALIGRWENLDIAWIITAGFSIGMLVGSAVGSRASLHIPAATLSRAFAVLLVVLGFGILAQTGLQP